MKLSEKVYNYVRLCTSVNMKNISSLYYGNYNNWGATVRIKLLVHKLSECAHKVIIIVNGGAIFLKYRDYIYDL